jgi:hypothetical protein
MYNSPDEIEPPRSSASAFRRVGVTVAVACVLAGSIAGLGAVGALAAATNPPVAAVPADRATEPAQPKVTYSDADLAAFAASPYADDALNLAVVWGLDTTTAQGKAGAKIQAGTALPFAPGEAATAEYSSDEQRSAFFLADPNFGQALGLAVAWESGDVYSAKARIGGLLLSHQEVPAAPTTFTEDQNAAAFTLVGYTDADAARLAALWQSHSTHSAQVRAGADLLAGNNLPL